MSSLRSLSQGQLIFPILLFLETGLGAYAQPAITVAPGSLAFTYQFGAGPPGQQYLAVKSIGAAHVYTAAVTSGNGWLSLSTGNGVTPGSLPVAVNTANLVSPGSYSGNIQIAIAGATNSSVNIPVTLTVSGTSPLGSMLSVTPGSLAFSYQLGSTPPGRAGVVYRRHPVR